MRFLIHLIMLWLVMLPLGASCAELSLAVADIAAPAFNVRGVHLVLHEDGSADLQAVSFKVQQREFHDIHLHCTLFTLTSAQVSCTKGALDAMPDAVVDVSYAFDTKRVQFALTSAGPELWQGSGQLGARDWQLNLKLRNAQVKRLAFIMSPDMPRLTQGVLTGSLMLGGNPSGLAMVNADMQLSDLAFSDAIGLHAAEKLRADIKLSARRAGIEWRWQGSIDWQSGELFWQPLYLRGGHQLAASGRYDGRQFAIDHAILDLSEVGRVQLSADWQQGVLSNGSLQGDGIALEKLFEVYAKPFLAKGALTDASLSGMADVDVTYRNGDMQALKLNLRNAGIADAGHRFSLLGVNSDIAWQADTSSTNAISFAGGELLGAKIGQGVWTVNMRGLEFDIPHAVLPILDGQLDMRDFHLHRAGKLNCLQADKACSQPVWHWHFAGGLTPISMEKLSQAAGWPKMLGTLAGRIPDVSYDGNEIRVSGALLFNVFDGTVVATGLRLADAFGRAPRFYGNLAMRHLDLDLLTRTFSFGNMLGRIDADVSKLELQNWQPVTFDARVYSSDGRYPKKISQKAVQNISSLGGAGAAAAIQRSYLGFFENFGYDRIGISCVLRNDVCVMGGIEASGHGGYTIIQGGGIPAISVMGYNRDVSWDVLTSRLKRVMQNNVKPVIE